MVRGQQECGVGLAGLCSEGPEGVRGEGPASMSREANKCVATKTSWCSDSAYARSSFLNASVCEKPTPASVYFVDR